MRKPKKPRLRGATNNIAKTYIYQIIILMVPMTAVFGIFLYLVFINAPLYVLGIVGFVGPLSLYARDQILSSIVFTRSRKSSGTSCTVISDIGLL